MMLEIGTSSPRRSTTPLARSLRFRRENAGLTQEELATRSGVSSRTISDLECGRVQRPQRRTLHALTAALASEEVPSSALEHLGTARPTPQGGIGDGVPDTPWLELPPDTAGFTGRRTEMERLLKAVPPAYRYTHGTATVAAVTGIAGVGKTAFVVRAGRHLSEHYPDGCIFLSMGGHRAAPLSAVEALGVVLRKCGIPAHLLPLSLEERSGLYRLLLRDKKMLLVLDDVAEEAQVRALLPDNPECLVLLSSRRSLAGLAATFRLVLGVLDVASSVKMLISIAGTAGTVRESHAAAEVARLCDRLPLAIRIAGSRLATRPGWSMDDLAHVLRDPWRRLPALTAGDLDLRSEFDASYRQCATTTRAVFRRLSLTTGPEITIDMGAVLAEVDRDTAECELELLVDAGLLSGTTRGCYVLSGLLRLFAAERLASEERGWVPGVSSLAASTAVGGPGSIADRQPSLVEPGL